MFLGKRPRGSMKRTTSMSDITFDLDCESVPPSSDPHTAHKQMAGFGGQVDQRFLSATVSPRTHRRSSADFLETAHFLSACFLCKRRLVPGRDIYMYRGDSAFCSLECRQQQMNQDERKEKCSLVSTKEVATSTTSPEVSTKGETVAAL
ncbi:hypothetical protein P3X46_021731 [Hevea brasiliensis]|uniref:Uncharacterized protein n=2 Tax=Hevea brasiliensis TaxID=3981 RepID=A0ABQ9LKG1_HEVBR|nr:FCS-Like Zinc finger 6 [Hevea brasiliensis]KAF2299639.1 hypothetical protein GH714_002123 [Hevea brasiliensis]KAJ9167049.1 hypothetical protein P3X46_021731 [Hevea brasiliensis]